MKVFYVVSLEDSTSKNKTHNFSYHQETTDRIYPLCFVVADGLLCFHLWSNDTSKVATFNYPFQSHRNPRSFEDLRCTKHRSYYYKQQPAFEHLPFALTTMSQVKSTMSDSVPTCLLEELVQKAV